MDRSASRRGLPTLHVVAADRHREQCGLGDAAAVRRQRRHPGLRPGPERGDACSSRHTAPAVRAAWRLMAVELVEGQLLDVTHTAGRRRDLPTSLRIARFKSGRYTITRPLQLGALVGGADPSLVRRLVTWGDLVGDAFAVRDDVLGVVGRPRPHRQARRRRPARRASPRRCSPGPSELLPDHARPLLAACDAGSLDDAGVDALQRAMVDAGVRDRAEQTVADLVDRAPPRARRPRRRPRGRRRAARPRRCRRLAVRVRVVVIGAGLVRPGRRLPPDRRAATTSPCSNAGRSVGGRAGMLRLGDFRIRHRARSS